MAKGLILCCLIAALWVGLGFWGMTHIPGSDPTLPTRIKLPPMPAGGNSGSSEYPRPMLLK